MEDIGNARRILEEVARSPGVHYRELQRRLGMPTGVVEYHVHRLVRDRLLVERKDGGHTRYFPVRGLTEAERVLLSFLRQDTPRQIVLFLLESPGSRRADLLGTLDVSGPAVSHHLKRMTEAGVIAGVREDGGARYRLAEPDVARKVLVVYRQSFIDRVVDRIVGSWGA
jgi:predicted transcriptional regulator